MGTALLTAVQTMSAHVLAPHLAEEKGLVTGYTFPFKTGEYGIIQHVRGCLSYFPLRILTVGTGRARSCQSGTLQSPLQARRDHQHRRRPDVAARPAAVVPRRGTGRHQRRRARRAPGTEDRLPERERAGNVWGACRPPASGRPGTCRTAGCAGSPWDSHSHSQAEIRLVSGLRRTSRNTP